MPIVSAPDISQQQPPAASFPFRDRDLPPKDVVIEGNWLGIRPDGSMPKNTSAFGVSVFNSLGTTIRRNRIANHDGSGIITSVRAENLLVSENILVGNGIAGMPDAIRLDGIVDNSEITSNLICGNDGSGVFLFKTEGAVQIRENDIKFNGRRLRRAAVYLMGNDHQVVDNDITNQVGPGVVVTSYPKSDRNRIQGNRFAALEGLSIDLNTQQNVGVQDFQRGDGPNPLRNSPNRRKETGNSAINTPEFLAREFFVQGNQVNVDGVAEPGSTVELYRVTENTTPTGPLSEPLGTAQADAQGSFGATLQGLKPGDQVSAIATHSEFGTSEPAVNAMVQSAANPVKLQPDQPGSELPECTTTPKPPAPPPPPEPPPPPPPPEPIRLRIPTDVHFALDKDNISAASAKVLDQIAAALKQYPSLTVELQGHTDPRASNAYNQDLANRRALSVRNYLLRKGIAPERMTIRSFGETMLKVPGSTAIVDYARDRRVEFLFKDIRGLDIILEPQEGDLQLER